MRREGGLGSVEAVSWVKQPVLPSPALPFEPFPHPLPPVDQEPSSRPRCWGWPQHARRRRRRERRRQRASGRCCFGTACGAHLDAGADAPNAAARRARDQEGRRCERASRQRGRSSRRRARGRRREQLISLTSSSRGNAARRARKISKPWPRLAGGGLRAAPPARPCHRADRTDRAPSLPHAQRYPPRQHTPPAAHARQGRQLPALLNRPPRRRPNDPPFIGRNSNLSPSQPSSPATHAPSAQLPGIRLDPLGLRSTHLPSEVSPFLLETCRTRLPGRPAGESLTPTLGLPLRSRAVFGEDVSESVRLPSPWGTPKSALSRASASELAYGLESAC